MTNFEVQKQIKNIDEHQNINDNKPESYAKEEMHKCIYKEYFSFTFFFAPSKRRKNAIQVFIGFFKHVTREVI